MKILKNGREQTGWSIESICTGKGNGDGGCGAKLLVEQKDLFETRGYHYDETDYFTTFTCPCCGIHTDLPESLVPRKIREGLRYVTQAELSGKTPPRYGD